MQTRLRPISSAPSDPRRAVIAAAFAAATIAIAMPASAEPDRYVPPRVRVGATLGFSALWGGPTAPGFGAGAHAAYAINDLFELMAAFHAGTYPLGPWSILSGAVGGAYVVDVGRVRPYVGGLAGVAGLVSTSAQCGLSLAEPCHATRLSLEAPFGADYQIGRRFTIGLGGRFQILLLGPNPWMTMGIYAKAEVTWGAVASPHR